MKKENLGRSVSGALLLVTGMVAGSMLQTTNTALGEVRGGPPPTAFQSGGQLSVPILKEMAATLHQIDGRLMKLEAVAQKLQASKATQR